MFFCRCVFCRAFLACCWLFSVRVGTLSRVTNGRHRQALATVFCVFWLNLCLLTLGRKIAEVGEMASARGGGKVFFCRCVFCRAFLACCWLFSVRVGTLSRVTNGRHRQALATVFCVFWLNLCLLTLGRKIAEVGKMLKRHWMLHSCREQDKAL